MGNFISNLIARHTTAANYVLPRLRGRFEPAPGAGTAERPAYFHAGVSPSADHVPAAANDLPEQPRDTPPPGTHIRENVSRPAAPPVNGTVAPPEGAPPLFTAPLNSVQEHVTAGNYPDPIPVPGAVNNLFADHRPSAASEVNTSPMPFEQEQAAAAPSLYFSIQPPGREGIAFTLNKGNGPTVFLPDRSIQRFGQYSAAASTPQQTIKVSIGRIDVRAVTQPATARSGAAVKPAMSLDDFLKKRSGGTS